MKVLKKLGCAVLVTGVLASLVGCGSDKNQSKKSAQEKSATDNMVYVGYEKVDDTKEFYFIDENGQIKTYSGYYSMKDFKNGLSIVEVKNEDFNGQMLIDANQKEIVRCQKIKEERNAGISIYVTTDENNKKGLYSLEGDKIADCKYNEIHFADLNISRSEGAIVAKYEDTSVDIYSSYGKYVYTVPAGYTDESYGFSGISVNSHIGDESIIEIKYGDTIKLFDAKTCKELDYKTFEHYRNGISLTDEKLILYNENFEAIKEIDFVKEGKQCTYGSRTAQNNYRIEYKDGKNTMLEIYNSRGELICSDNAKKVNIGTVIQGGNEYLIHIKEDGVSYLDENGKEVFFKPSGSKIEECNVDGFFLLRSDDGVKIYNTKDLTPYNDVLYKGGTITGLFFNDEYYMFNEYGNLYTMKKTDDVTVYDYTLLQDGYVTYCTMKGDERKRYILDVSGNGKPVEIPWVVSFCENIPCYKVDKIYYNYSGKEIFDESKYNK